MFIKLYAWTPLIDEMLQVVEEDTNEDNEYAVTITKGGCIVRHIREIGCCVSSHNIASTNLPNN